MSWGQLARDPIGFLRGKLQVARLRKDPVAYLRHRGAVVGENVFIDKNVEIEQRASFLLEIGNDVGIGENTRIILHDSSTWSHCGLPTKFGRVVLRDHVYIGVGSILLPGIEIGAGTVVGAGSLVTRSLPPAVVAAGVPAKVLCSVEDYRQRMKEQMESNDPLLYWIKPVNRESIAALRDQVERERRGEGVLPEHHAEATAISDHVGSPSPSGP